MPFHVLGIWVRGLLSVALLALAVGLLRQWDRDRTWVEVVPAEPVRAEAATGRPAGPEDGRGAERRVHTWHFGLNRATACLVGGLALLALGLGGGSVVYPLLRPAGHDEPRSERGGEARRLSRPDGAELQVEFYGPDDAPTLVLTHGWGANSTEWYYVKEALAGRFRLVVWDLPGLGLSTRPADNDWSLEKLAGHLDAVIGLAGDRPVVLVGHSIGGMTMLTFAKVFPESLRRRVAGLVLVHTTYTNPVLTTSKAPIYTALQKPVLEPLCHLMVWLSPLVWAMNWLSYLNGSVHRSCHREMFAGRETRGQLDFVARFQPKAWPGVVARGMLAMFRYDATPALTAIDVPTLVVAADQDITTKPEASEFIALNAPGAEIVALSPARHMGLIEHPATFNQVLERFVTSLPRTAPVGSAG